MNVSTSESAAGINSLSDSGAIVGIHEELKTITMQWAAGKGFDSDRTRTLRHNAAFENHRYYRKNIPYYEKLCKRSGVQDDVSIETIKEKLMLSDDIFKSYPQRYLNQHDFKSMNQWLRNISTVRPSEKADHADGIDSWIDALSKEKINLVFSSGTSGHISFVPRNAGTWKAFTELGYLYMPLLLASRGILTWWKKLALRFFAARMSPEKFSAFIQRVGTRDRDGFFLNFKGGNQGIQLVAEKASRLTRKSFFLYDRKISADALRTVVTGNGTEKERETAKEFFKSTVHAKKEHYKRFSTDLQKAAKEGVPVTIFGTPYLLQELCDYLQAHNMPLKLNPKSTVFYGGGWKSFTGQRISEVELINRITASLGVKRKSILEGYSMTEIQGLMVRCTEDRYHVPPFCEVAIFDEELNPKTGKDLIGTLGIIDPFARSYPGFVMTGDNVHLHKTLCKCGLQGPSIERIERSASRETKGCGGIMAAVNA